MAATIDATVGGAASNSYSTVADADTYFETRLNASAWETDATADDKVRALIQATFRLDQEDYQGDKVATGQALEWPRVGATDRDGHEFDGAAIPEIVKRATYELALRFLNDGTSDTLADTGMESIDTVSVGGLTVEPSPVFRAGQLPQTVTRLLQPVRLSSSSSARVLRG